MFVFLWCFCLLVCLVLVLVRKTYFYVAEFLVFFPFFLSGFWKLSELGLSHFEVINKVSHVGLGKCCVIHSQSQSWRIAGGDSLIWVLKCLECLPNTF